MGRGMELTLVIPVRDDAARLGRLLQQAEDLAVFDQVIVVDDGSEVPVTFSAEPPVEEPVEQLSYRPAVQVLRRDLSGGAGAARNQGLAAVRTSHVLFFDSDDHLTEALVPLWQELQAWQAHPDRQDRAFAFCQFRHHDSRMGTVKRWGQMPYDDRFWRQAGLGGQGLDRLGPDQAPLLAQTSNYPWNKIYNVDFLRRHDLRCTEIPLHNDVELHWASFVSAVLDEADMLVSHRIVASHEVQPFGHRLTNRTGADRLCLFDALAALQPRFARLPKDQALRWRGVFLQFLSDLFSWVRGALAVEFHAVLDQRIRQFLHEMLDPALQRDLAQRDPVIALQLLLQMGAAAPQLAAQDQARGGLS